jgi:predicted  nucleic acid-binding Zn-ribbon protein
MTETNHEENVYALRAHDQKTIHISEVPRKETGRGPGYFCLGCKRRLQAVLSDIENRKKFFRHDAESVKGQPKCTYSDETYRHKLSKEIIQRIGKIKVPNLYKFFLDEEIPKKYLIQESTYIEASKILIEHYLFEDKNGNINYSREIDPEKELFIKPDVIFLDSNGKPILIIELVATHKPKNDKLIKLKRLGINAIQIRIPKDSPESIENIFSQTTNTVWIYNEQEERFTIPFSGAHSERVSESDAIQRSFFEENFTCRQAQIRNLIRGIERLLESEHYTNTVEDLRSEIQRVEGNTETHRERLDDLREKFSERGAKQHSDRREELGKIQSEFQEYTINLEKRYLTKRGELDEKRGILEQHISEAEYRTAEIDTKGTEATRTVKHREDAIDRIRGAIENLPGRFGGEQFEIAREEERVGHKTIELEQAEESIRRAIDESKKLFVRQEKDLARELETELQRIVDNGNRIEKEIIDAEKEYGNIENGIRREYPSNREEYLERVENGNFKGSRWFASESEKLRELLPTIKIHISLTEELRRIEEENSN